MMHRDSGKFSLVRARSPQCEFIVLSPVGGCCRTCLCPARPPKCRLLAFVLSAYVKQGNELPCICRFGPRPGPGGCVCARRGQAYGHVAVRIRACRGLCGRAGFRLAITPSLPGQWHFNCRHLRSPRRRQLPIGSAKWGTEAHPGWPLLQL